MVTMDDPQVGVCDTPIFAQIDIDTIFQVTFSLSISISIIQLFCLSIPQRYLIFVDNWSIFLKLSIHRLSIIFVDISPTPIRRPNSFISQILFFFLGTPVKMYHFSSQFIFTLQLGNISSEKVCFCIHCLRPILKIKKKSSHNKRWIPASYRTQKRPHY